MVKAIKVYSISIDNNINCESENPKRVNNILFLLNDAIFSLMNLNTKVSRLIINDNNEILNAMNKCPTYKDFLINSYMLEKLKDSNEGNIEFINIDKTIISIRDLENIFITVHDNYQINKIIEPKFYKNFHKEKNLMDYIMETYELSEVQEKILFKILDNITSISEKKIELANDLFLELNSNYDNGLKNFKERRLKNKLNKEENYILKLMEMKDLVDNKNLLKAIKNRVILFEKYAKATESLLELLPLEISENILEQEF